MAESWGDVFCAYAKCSPGEVTVGTILRRVPFALSPLADGGFKPLTTEKSEKELSVNEILASPKSGPLQEVRAVQFGPGIVVTPACDIAQGKAAQVLLAQLVEVEEFLKGQKADAVKTLRSQVETANFKTNPGQVNLKSGLIFLPSSESCGMPSHIVNLSTMAILPCEMIGSSPRFTEACYGGASNLWCNVGHEGLRSRLVAEFVRHFGRIGLEDLPTLE